jgi:septal ring factor EnvC (AmiA/AmiB activator)
MKRLLTSLLIIVSLPTLAFATALQAQKHRLEKVQESLETAESEHALTQAQARRVTHEMVRAEEDILRKAGEITKVEQALAVQQREVQALFEKEARQSRALEQIRGTISHMVSAAWSIQYRPQLAAWLLPEETRERALASRALHMATVSLNQHMEKANHAMQELQTLRASIVEKQQANETLQQSLMAQRKALQESTTQQQSMLAKLRRSEVGYARQIASLSQQSASLETLIGKLETARTQGRRLGKKPLPPSVPSEEETLPRAASFALAKGRLPLPAEGRIAGRFGERRGNNDRLKGLEIATLKGALVTAPYEGEVLYTGKFLDYGNMVILRHSRDYHTLVAGLHRIDVSVGQFLLDGAPIGAMGESGEVRTLYLELRKSSQAIDPLPWFVTRTHDVATR